MSAPKFSMERLYDVLRHPVITEKATLGSNHNQVTFRVPLDATKAEMCETGADDDGWFALSIDRATAAIEHWCRRSFAAETVRESVWLTSPAESVSLSRWPVLSVASLLEGGTQLPPDAFEVDDGAGLAYRLTGPDTRRMWRA